MIKVLICCAGGFSSSALTKRVENEIITKNMTSNIQVSFLPFSLAVREFEGFDLIMVCPHQQYEVKRYNEDFVKNKIPIYVIPPRIYGTMPLSTIYPDALDLIEIFKKNPQNPTHFPNEENTLRVQRTIAYRNL